MSDENEAVDVSQKNQDLSNSNGEQSEPDSRSLSGVSTVASKKPLPISNRRRSERISVMERSTGDLLDTQSTEQASHGNVNSKNKQKRSESQKRKHIKKRTKNQANIWNIETNSSNSEASSEQRERMRSGNPTENQKTRKRSNKENEPPVSKKKKSNDQSTTVGISTDVELMVQVQDEDDLANSKIPWKSRDVFTDAIFGIFVDVVKLDGNYMKARCSLCDEDNPANVKSFSKGNTSNLKTHLKRAHPKVYDQMYTESKLTKENLKMENMLSHDKKQEIQNSIVQLFIKERLPLSKMNSKYFNLLIKACLGQKNKKPDAKVESFMTSRVGRARITELAKEQREKLKKKFESIEYFSATSDMWTRSNRSFIAVSVHYIDNITENVKTEFIACESFEGNHTNDRVAEKLNKIFENFGILEKVFFITTDSAGNYVAAFKNYGDNYESIERLFDDENLIPLNRSEDEASVSPSIDSESEDETEDLDQMVRDPNTNTTETTEQFRVVELFTPDSDIDSDEEMDSVNAPYRRLLGQMNHINCSSHMLDKVGSKDALKAKEYPTYDEMCSTVFGKLEVIWSQKESRLRSELFTRITGRKLIGPHRIRWMKTFDAVANILSIDQDKLETACTSLNISPLTADELIFLTEYHKILKPVAIALKTLEANKHMFGLYLPVLFGLRSKLNELKSSTIRVCLPLLNSVETGFERRFGNMLDIFHKKSVPLYIAMASHPKYKLNFMGMRRIAAHTYQQIRKMLFNAGVDIVKSERERVSEQQAIAANESSTASLVNSGDRNTDNAMPSSSSDRDDLLDLECSLLVENDVTATMGSIFDVEAQVEQEIHNYLNCKTTSDIEAGLKDFPIVKKIFKKFNCIRSTEAICERLFSYAGMILTDKRGRLTAQLFEDLLILHMNDWQ